MPSARIDPLPPELLVALHKWREERQTGFLILNFRHGVIKGIEHQIKEFLENNGKSALGAPVPPCPACGQPMQSRDSGAMWECPPCRVKRTEAQLRGG